MSNAQTLAEKLEKLQAEQKRVAEKLEEAKAAEAIEKAIAGVRDTFTKAITEAVRAAERSSGKSLSEVGLGVWVGVPKGSSKFHISALETGEDGLPKALRRSTKRAGNGSNGDGSGTACEYALTDGRAFDTVHAALDAMSVPKEGRGQYWHRHDRLPNELAAKITKRPKAAKPAQAAPAS